MPDNKNIDEMYDLLIQSGKDFENGNTSEAMKKIQDISDNLDYADQIRDEEVHNTPVPENIQNTAERVMASFDPESGNMITTECNHPGIQECIDKGILDDKMSESNITQYLKESSNDSIDDKDAIQIATLVAKRMAGETTGFYDELPESAKSVVRQVMFQSNTNNIKSSMIKNKNVIARDMIDSIIEDIKNSPEMGFDIDSVISDFDNDINNIITESSVSLAGMMQTFDEERKANIDAAIKRCEESGNIEGMNKLIQVRNNIDSAFNLNEFKEFCKSCKIKRFEIEKPTRVINSFNIKYDNHKNSINDISACPSILDRHIKDNDHKDNLMICLAFCKYCENMSPDNMNEHTFMYYFIRNIILLDRMNPKNIADKGLMDEKFKDFYYTFIENLKECSSNLKARNHNI